jgi:hypothetical protein
MYSASAKSILNRKRERAPKAAGNARRAQELLHGVERSAMTLS